MATAESGEEGSVTYNSSQALKLELIETLSGHDERVWCVTWCPKGKLLASCGADKTVRIWAKEDGKMVSNFRNIFI